MLFHFKGDTVRLCSTDSKVGANTDLPTLTVWPWDSRFGMPSHGLSHGEPENLKIAKTFRKVWREIE